MVKEVTSHTPLNDATRESFISNVTEVLSEHVGPAAEIIVNDAFEYLESDPQLIYKSEIPELFEAISKHLDEEDGIAFKKWAIDCWKGFCL